MESRRDRIRYGGGAGGTSEARPISVHGNATASQNLYANTSAFLNGKSTMMMNGGLNLSGSAPAAATTGITTTTTFGPPRGVNTSMNANLNLSALNGSSSNNGGSPNDGGSSSNQVRLVEI